MNLNNKLKRKNYVKKIVIYKITISKKCFYLKIKKILNLCLQDFF